MNTQRIVKRFGALALAGALTGGTFLGFAGTALAAGTATSTVTPAPAGIGLTNLKQACEAAIDKRLGSLATLGTTVSTNTYLTADHKALLGGEITGETTGLTALRAKIAADTVRSVLVADCRSIVDEYRVYLLMTPKVHLMIAGDAAVAIGARFGDLAAKLQADINVDKASGKDVTDAQRDLNNMEAAVASATGAAAPVPTVLNFALPLNPSDYLNDRQDVLTARSDVNTAHTDFVQARSDVKQVITDLKALAPVKPVTATATAHS